jgi:hypothetical protein
MKKISRRQGQSQRIGQWMLAVSLAFGQLACGGSDGEGPIMPTLCTEAFTACGGDPLGMWSISGSCLDGDLAAAINGTHTAACMSQTTAADVKVTGSLNYMGAAPDTLAVYNATVTTRSTESISPACATEAYGVTTLDAAACTQIQTTIKNSDPELMAETTVSCSLAGTNCDCRITIADVQMAQNFVTVTGSNIVESDNTTYDFCISGTKMTQKHMLAGNVSAVVTLAKK